MIKFYDYNVFVRWYIWLMRLKKKKKWRREVFIGFIFIKVVLSVFCWIFILVFNLISKVIVYI